MTVLLCKRCFESRKCGYVHEIHTTFLAILFLIADCWFLFPTDKGRLQFKRPLHSSVSIALLQGSNSAWKGNGHFVPYCKTVFHSLHYYKWDYFIDSLHFLFQIIFQYTDLCNSDMVFMPIHLSVLWCLCVILPKQKLIKFFNTMKGENEECVDVSRDPFCISQCYYSSEWLPILYRLNFQAVINFMNEVEERQTTSPIDWTGWSVDSDNSVADNQTIEDSPILICCFARCICDGLSCLFGLDTLQEVRQQMRKEITDCQLAELKLPPYQVSWFFHELACIVLLLKRNVQ